MDTLGHYDHYELGPNHGGLHHLLEKRLPFDAVFYLSEPGELDVKDVFVEGYGYVKEKPGPGAIRLFGVCYGIIRVPTAKTFTSAIKISVTSPEEWKGALAVCWFDSRPGATVPGIVEIRPGGGPGR